MRREVAASLRNVAEIMKASQPDGPTFWFKENDLVWLEATNLKTTHPKVKLAPKRYGPFKVLTSYPVNCKLALPKSWKIHLVFHNSLLKPYKETPAHGPNFARPPPEVIDKEGEHYEVKAILKSRVTPNQRGIQYLVKWKGYPSSENSWVSATDMKNAPDLTKTFHNQYPKMPYLPLRNLSLQAQTNYKEGILSWDMTSRLSQTHRTEGNTSGCLPAIIRMAPRQGKVKGNSVSPP